MNRLAKKYMLLLSITLLGIKGYGQQNIQFTQYIFNSISVNPAYAGYKEEWFGQMGLRSQWTGWDGAPQTGTISIDGVLDPYERRHGVGLQVSADKLGAQAATSIYANYALRLQLDRADEHRLSLGIAGGVTQYSLDGAKLVTIDDDDPILPTGKIGTWRPDIRLGAYYSNPRWYAGVSVQDLFAGSESGEDYQFNQNSLESLYRNIHGYFIAGALFELERGLLLRPSILIKDDFKGPTSLDFNAMFIFNDKFWIGAGYRTRSRIFNRDYTDYSANKLSSLNSVSGIAQFYVSPKFRIGYSYDHMLNRLSGLQNGTHEVTLGVTFGRVGRQVLSPRYF
ncbi:type IX secretion system membrane protein PorP/SprF [Sphingobacterium alkalisoli]|uniref:Type IX secretion system membrane protein PorP/SprF n=1 Tax=Sphingobacterium alkalisoli TaxID=1874115 RepID=A0A4U0H5G7_9SPHI|nr:type IX secretion system membrane protein PorP/SprF [Sphingobacterium alkalisoli]TJY66981.1 type IX secretion system membrane protein PorP/SprF [Sphingobacterium alkalisoli]GGH12993.1 membrane protein [Sphingobacterium alkalisoli]